MTRGKFGGDSNNLVTAEVEGKTLIELATEFFGEAPLFWGRYFKRPGNTSTEQYQAARENKALHDRNIRLLPLARQTGNVGGNRARGQQDGARNVDAYLASLGVDYVKSQGSAFVMFLDTEPRPGPAMSVNYYVGWAGAVIERSRELTAGAVTVLPCVYLNHNDEQTCNALTSAVEDHGAECHGVWVARYPTPDANNCLAARDWSSTFVRPEARLPCDILLWQYFGDCHEWLDGNQTNPAIDLQDSLLSKLILPPPA